MKDILMVTHFTQVPGEKGNSRFKYISDLLSEEDVKLEVVTTNFSHREKTGRHIKKEDLDLLKYKLTMIDEPGYKKNVSIKRFYSHYVMSKNLSKYLEKRRVPDVIYCSIPSIDVAYVVAKYANKNNVKLIIDVQDLWPEAFKMVLNIPILSDLIFKPMENKANYVYKSADKIIAVSETYLNRALKVNRKSAVGESVYLGTDLNYFDSICNGYNIAKPDGEIWLTYIGTLGNSYDIVTVINALKLVKEKGIDSIKFIVVGDGPLKNKFENYAKEKGVYTLFTGRLEYEQMVQYLRLSDIAVNPIVKGSAGSIINKVGDYAAAGLPVLNTQECEEYRNLIELYNCGLNCINGDEIDLYDKLIYLYNNKAKRLDMGKQSRKLAEEKFNRQLTYKKIIENIKEESMRL